MTILTPAAQAAKTAATLNAISNATLPSMDAPMEDASTSNEDALVFHEYDTQLAIPEVKGYRTVKCLYRYKDSVPAAKRMANSYVRVPTSHLSVEAVSSRMNELMPHLIAYLQGLEDAAIKEMHKSGKQAIDGSALTLDAIIAQLNATREVANRLSKETIGAWFDGYVSDALGEAFAAKMGIELNEDAPIEALVKIEQVVEMYKGKLCSLAAPKVTMQTAELKVLEVMFGTLTGCTDDDAGIGSRLLAKIVAASKKEEEVLLSL